MTEAPGLVSRMHVPDVLISRIQPSRITFLDHLYQVPLVWDRDTPFGRGVHVIFPDVDFLNIVGIVLNREIDIRDKDVDPTEPWWLSRLERHIHWRFIILKVEGSNPGVVVYFRVNGNGRTRAINSRFAS